MLRNSLQIARRGPPFFLLFFAYWNKKSPVAQLVEHMAVNHSVVGSNPTRGGFNFLECSQVGRRPFLVRAFKGSSPFTSEVKK
jgi:hypothetical protein